MVNLVYRLIAYGHQPKKPHLVRGPMNCSSLNPNSTSFRNSVFTEFPAFFVVKLKETSDSRTRTPSLTRTGGYV
jgi:hypothetical protein